MLLRLSLSRLSLIIATLFAANLSLAETPTASAPFTPEQQQLIRQISAKEAQAQVPVVVGAVKTKVESIASSTAVKAVEGEKAIDVAKDALEVGRKSVDWWLSNIGVLIALFGLVLTAAAFGIPYAMGLKKQAEWQEKLTEFAEKLAEAKTALQQVEEAKRQVKTTQQQAEKHLDEINTLRNTAHDLVNLIPSMKISLSNLSDERIAELRKIKPGHVVDLIDRGWQAGRARQWETAKTLWELISLIESSDPGVWTNLGFIYVNLGDLEQASRCYTFSNALFSNAQRLSDLGNALGDWASTLPDSEATKRIGLFRQSKDLLAQAASLSPRPKYFKDLSATYIAWARHSPDMANYLLAEAEHLVPKLDERARDYTLACIRAVQGDAENARVLLEQTRAAGFLPDHAHLNSDKDLDSLRELDWFKDLLEAVRQQEKR